MWVSRLILSLKLTKNFFIGMFQNPFAGTGRGQFLFKDGPYSKMVLVQG